VKTSLVLTLIGLDKPGLVETLSQTAAAHGANWEESRMARLAGRFAGLLLVTVDRDKAEALEADLRSLEQRGLRVVVEREVDGPAEAGGARVKLELEGSDQPGIVRQLSAALARREINVEELRSQVTSAPMAGHALFRASASLRLPAGLTRDALRRDLEGLASDLVVEIELQDD